MTITSDAIEASRKLLEAWDDYRASSGNMEEAYYKLAKYAWNDWEALRAALSVPAAAVVGEPVAWMRYSNGSISICFRNDEGAFPVYRTAPEAYDAIDRRAAFDAGWDMHAALSPAPSAPDVETECEFGIPEPKFIVGQLVEKSSGYKWPGVVVSRFLTQSLQIRYVVECTVPEVAGALHIYSESQIVALGDASHE